MKKINKFSFFFWKWFKPTAELPIYQRATWRQTIIPTHSRRETIQSCQLSRCARSRAVGRKRSPGENPRRHGAERTWKDPKEELNSRPPAAVVISKAAYKPLCQQEAGRSPRMQKNDWFLTIRREKNYTASLWVASLWSCHAASACRVSSCASPAQQRNPQLVSGQFRMSLLAYITS